MFPQFQNVLLSQYLSPNKYHFIHLKNPSMKNLMLLIALFFFASTAFSQGVKWGPRVGISTSQVSPQQLVVTDQSGLDALTLDLKNAKFGFNGGLFLRAETQKSLFFQTELHFSTTTIEYQIEELNSPTPIQEIASETYYDLNLPVHVGLKFGSGVASFRIQGGAILTKNIGGNSNISDFVTDYQQAFQDLNVGWQAGVGLDIWKVTFDARYEGDFGNYANHMQFFGNDVEFDDRERQLKFSLGWKF